MDHLINAIKHLEDNLLLKVDNLTHRFSSFEEKVGTAFLSQPSSTDVAKKADPIIVSPITIESPSHVSHRSVSFVDCFSDEELSQFSNMDFDLPAFSLSDISQPGAAPLQQHTSYSPGEQPVLPALSPPRPQIPRPTFETPPKLKPIEHSLQMVSGTDEKSLRLLAVRLARDSIFGEEELGESSLSGRNNTKVLDSEKLDYIRKLIYSRVGEKVGEREFNLIWKNACLHSISKECQRLRSKK